MKNINLRNMITEELFRIIKGSQDALFSVIKKVQIEFVREILSIEGGFFVNVRNKDTRRTALMVAAENNNVEIARVLLEAGALVDMQYDIGETALMFAAEKGHAEVVEELLRFGANINMYDELGVNSLMRAAKGESLDCVKTLLYDERIDPNWVDVEETSAFIYSLLFSPSIDVVKEFLFYKNTNINDCYDGYRNDYFNRESTALIIASATNKDWGVEIVRELIKKGIDVDAQDRKGNTALMKATSVYNTDIVMELLSANASPNIQNEDGWTPLIYAVLSEHEGIIKDLLADKRTDVDIKAKDDLKAIDCTSSTKIKKLLLKKT